MPPLTNIDRFIASTFRSVWALELLLELKRTPDGPRSKEDLVTALRASDVVVIRGVEGLLAAGLITEENDGSVRYAPASAELDEAVCEAAGLYQSRPDAVRRLIVASSTDGLNAFSDAFKIRGID